MDKKRLFVVNLKNLKNDVICQLSLTFWKDKDEDYNGNYYEVRKQLIAKNGFTIYDFKFNFTKFESALNKFEIILKDLESDDFKKISGFRK